MTGPERRADLDMPLTVAPSTLSSHAAKVQALSRVLASARQAAATVSLAKDAYGLLCAGVPLLLETLQAAVIDCMDQGQLSLQDSSAQLRKSAESYESVETQSEHRVDQLVCDTVTTASTDPQP